jgi:hypothetical protein
MSVDADVREAVCAQHRLDPKKAASFLTGESLAELDESAERLARLLETSRHDEEPPAPVDPITAAIAGRQAQKRRLADLIIGRRPPQQPRDEHGRYASFDGGPRGQPIPTAPSPEQQHDQAILALARLRALGG